MYNPEDLERIQQQHELFRIQQQQLQQQNTLNNSDRMLLNQQSFAMMQQQMQFNRMQSQTAYSGFGGSTYIQPINNLPLSTTQFLDRQMQGIYSGLGITPQMRDTVSNYIVNPLAGPVNRTISLGSGLAMAALSYTPTTMSYEQRDTLARSLAYNTTMMGTSAAGFGTSLVAGGAGLYAASRAMSKWGAGRALLGGAVIAGGLMGVEALTTNRTIAALTGHFGYNPQIFHPFDYIREELGEAHDLSQLLTNESYRFMSPSAGRNIYGRGLGRQDVYTWTNAIRTWDTKFRMKDTDIQQILRSTIDNNLINNVTGLEEFEAKFSRQVDYIKNASKILNKSYEEISDMMGEFKRAGISPDNFDLKAAELKAYASLLGKNVDAVKEFMLSSVKLYTQNTGLSGATVGGQVMFTTGIMNQAYSNAKTAGNQAVVDLITNFGGPEGAQAAVRSGMQIIFSSPTARAMLQSVVVPLAGGGFKVDEAAVKRFQESAAMGGVNLDTLMQSSKLNSQNWSPWQMTSFLNQYPQLFMNQNENTLNQMLNLVIKSMQNTEFYRGASNTDILTNIFGLDANSANLVNLNMQTYATDATRVNIASKLAPLSALSVAIRENWASDRIRGGYYTSTEWFDEFYGNIAVKPAQTFESYLQDIMNKRAGLPNEDLVNTAITQYFDFSDAGIARKKVMDTIERLDLSSQLYDAIERLDLSSSSRADISAVNRHKEVEDEFSRSIKNQIDNILARGYQYDTRTYSKTHTTEVISGTQSGEVLTTFGGTTPYDTFFDEAGRTYNVDPTVLKAMAYIESTMNPNAVSEAGAQGLMQVMAKYHARNGEDLFDPRTNIMIGSKVLAGHLQRYGGNYGLAAAAYNMGGPGLEAEMLDKLGLDVNKMTPQELAAFDVNKIMPYLYPQTANHIRKYYAALNQFGYNEGAVVTSVDRTQRITEYGINRDFALLMGGLNVPIGIDQSQLGFITRKIEESIKPTSVDSKSLLNSIDAMQTLHNEVLAKGMVGLSGRLESSLGYLKYLGTAGPGDLSDEDIDREIDNLQQTLKEFSNSISEGAKKTITDAINFLNAHKSRVTITFDTIATTAEATNVSDIIKKGLHGANLLPVDTDTRNKIHGGVAAVGASLNELYAKPLGLTSSSEIISLVKAYNELRPSIDSLEGQDGATQFMRTTNKQISDSINNLIRNKVLDVSRNTLEREYTFNEKQLLEFSGKDLNTAIESVNLLGSDLESAYLRGDLEGVRANEQKYYDVVTNAFKIGRAQQQVIANNVIPGIQKVNLDTAKADVSYRLNKEMEKDVINRDAVNKLKTQNEFLQILQRIQKTGNLDVLKGYSTERITTMLGAVTDVGAPESVRALGGLGSGFTEYTGKESTLVNFTKTMPGYTDYASLTSDEYVPALITGGAETALLKQMKHKIETDTITVEDIKTMQMYSKSSSSPQSVGWSMLLDATMKAQQTPFERVGRLVALRGINAKNIQDKMDVYENAGDTTLSQEDYIKYLKGDEDAIALATKSQKDLLDATRIFISGTKKKQAEADQAQSKVISTIHSWEKRNSAFLEGKERPSTKIVEMFQNGAPMEEIYKVVVEDVYEASRKGKAGFYSVEEFQTIEDYLRNVYTQQGHQGLPLNVSLLTPAITKSLDLSAKGISDTKQLAALGSKAAGMTVGIFKESLEPLIDKGVRYQKDLAVYDEATIESRRQAALSAIGGFEQHITDMLTGGFDATAFQEALKKDIPEITEAFSQAVVGTVDSPEVREAVTTSVKQTLLNKYLGSIPREQLDEDAQKVYDAVKAEIESITDVNTKEGAEKLSNAMLNLTNLVEAYDAVTGKTGDIVQKATTETEKHTQAMDKFYNMVHKEIVDLSSRTTQLETDFIMAKSSLRGIVAKVFGPNILNWIQ